MLKEMTDSERAYLAAKWLKARKREQGNAEMTDDDLEAWREMVRGLPGWEPGPPVMNGVPLNDLWRVL